ncbi:MAG: hypothetical protein HQK66_10760, partial [Desulfamplus sp.]|nr:hypothetical protein [Desulfamplus sp.]
CPGEGETWDSHISPRDGHGNVVKVIKRKKQMDKKENGNEGTWRDGSGEENVNLPSGDEKVNVLSGDEKVNVSFGDEKVNILSRDEIMSIINGMRKNGATFDQVALHLVELKQPTFSGRGEWHAQTIHRLCSKYNQ